MRTLTAIKNAIAIENGCTDWGNLLISFHKGSHESFYDKVSLQYSNEKLQYAADNIEWDNCYDGGDHCGRDKHEQQILKLKD